MVSSITSGGARSAGVGSGAQAQINGLLGNIKKLRKQITALQKQLMETSDPQARLQLIKEIEDLNRTVQLLERQIAQIEENERRKAETHRQAQLEMKKEEEARRQR
jgi:predicted  nucleic acid-binding Zn-ribbon protein